MPDSEPASDPSARWDRLDREAYAIPHDRIAEREPLLVERLQVAVSFGLDDPRLEKSHGSLLGYYYCDVGRYDKVAVVCAAWIALKRGRLTADPHDIHVLHEYGLSLSMAGREAEAEAQYRRALRLVEDAHGVGSPQTYGPLYQLAQYLHNRKQHAEAVPLGERLFEMMRGGRAGRWDHLPWFLAEDYRALGRLADAEAIRREELEWRLRERLDDGTSHLHLRANSLAPIASLVAEQGRLDAAVELMREAIAVTVTMYAQLIARHEKFLREAESRGLRTAGPLRRWHEMSVLAAFGDLLRRAGHLEEAEAVYRDLLVLQEADQKLPPSGLAPYADRFGGEVIARANSAAHSAEQRSGILKGLAAVLHDAGRDAEADALAAEADGLASEAASLRGRVNRVIQKSTAREVRPDLVPIEDLRRLLSGLLPPDC